MSYLSIVRLHFVVTLWECKQLTKLLALNENYFWRIFPINWWKHWRNKEDILVIFIDLHGNSSHYLFGYQFSWYFTLISSAIFIVIYWCIIHSNVGKKHLKISFSLLISWIFLFQTTWNGMWQNYLYKSFYKKMLID